MALFSIPSYPERSGGLGPPPQMNCVRPHTRDHGRKDHAAEGQNAIHPGKPHPAIGIFQTTAQHQISGIGQPHHRG